MSTCFICQTTPASCLMNSARTPVRVCEACATLAEDYFLAPKHAYCDRCTKVHPIAWSKVGTQNGWFRLFCLCLECLVWDRPPEEASLLRTLYSVDDTVSTCPPLRRSTRVANRTAS